MPPMLSVEAYYMQQCLALAARGRGRVSPNPMVGCVVLNAQGKKVAEGFHGESGPDHAEIVALRRAGDQARGGTLYINLEPCAHTGETPPCTETVIAAGIERVMCGTLDPNPLVNGKGRDQLQNAHISVRSGFLEPECRRLNATFFHVMTTGQPWVTLKMAMTVDGHIAARSGRGEWMTGPLARQVAHQLRLTHDAILTTAQTVLADDPQLSVRDATDDFGEQPRPWRIILDRQLRLDPARFGLFKQAPETPPRVWVITAPQGMTHPRVKQLEALGVRVTSVPSTTDGLDMTEVWRQLAAEPIHSVLIEAGGQLAGTLAQQQHIDRYALFYAPRLLGDTAAPSGFSGRVVPSLTHAMRLLPDGHRALGDDWLVEATAAHTNPQK